MSDSRVHLDHSRLFHRKALGALVAAALSMSAAFAGVWVVLESVEEDPAAVNVAGRQRMLSQRATLDVVLLADPGLSESARQRHEARLEDTVHEMRRAVVGLTEGDADLGLSGEMTPPLAAHYNDEPVALRASTLAYLDRLDAALAASRDLGRVPAPTRDALQTAGDDLLPQLHTAVGLHEVAAGTHIGRVQTAAAFAGFVFLFGLAGFYG